MKKLIVAVVGILFCLSQSLANDSVDVPEIRVGDQWVVQGIDLWKNEVNWKVRREVTKVDGQTATWRYEMLPPSRQATGENRFDIPTQTIKRDSFLAGLPERTRFPLAVGKEWTYSYEFRNDKGGTTRYDMRARVVGKEQVTVPAGTFEAYRIEHEGWWERSEISWRARAERTVWYSPAAKSVVKEKYIGYKANSTTVWDQDETQLVEFSLSAN